MQRLHHIAQVADAVDLDALHHRGLGGAAVGHEHAAHAVLAGQDRRREHAADLADRAVEPELPEHDQTFEQRAVQLLVAQQHARGDREIQRGAGLAQIRRCEVHHDALQR